MAADPLQRFLEEVNTRQPANPFGDIPDQGPLAETELSDIFQAGVRTGVSGLATDIEYFKALGNTLLGDEEGAAQNIRRARVQEDLTAAELQGVESFKDFLDEPTAMGFLRQVSKGTGQIAPSAITSIAGAGAGALVGTGVRYLGSKSAQATAKQILQDSIERTAKGTATPDEQKLADLAYNKMRQDIRDRIAGGAKIGGITGAAAAEYPPLAGSNVSEVIDSGEELTTDRAMESALLAIPQTVVGVGAEAAMFSVIKNIATSRAAKEGGFFWELAKSIGKGAGLSAPAEGAAEFLQEGMSVAYRSSMDDDFSREDAQLRLAEATFAGFFGGGGLGAAGGGVGGIISNSGAIVDKSKDLLAQAQEFKAKREIDKQQYGDVLGGQTTPEPQADINAQVNALTDDSSAKHSVWVAGTEAQFLAKTNEVTPVEVAGETMYSVFIPARGTLLSRNRNVAEEVLAAGASDAALSKALSYSATKNEVTDGDIVVRALDKDRNVVSEELTDEANLAKAEKAARRLMPKGGSIDTSLDVKGALEDRNRRLQAEQGPVVRSMEVTGDTVAILDAQGREVALPDSMLPPDGEVFQTPEQAERFLENLKETDAIKNNPESLAMVNSWRVGVAPQVTADIIDDRAPLDDMGEISQTADLDEEVDPNDGRDPRLETTYLYSVFEPTEKVAGSSKGYKAREAPDRVYPKTFARRQAFKKAFEDVDAGIEIDFDTPFFGNMSDSFLKNAVEFKDKNPDLTITWDIVSAPDGATRYVLKQSVTPDTEMISYMGRGEQKVSIPLSSFLSANIDRATDQRSKFVNPRIKLVAPDGTATSINPNELTNAGKRLIEVDTGTFEGASPLTSAKAGFKAMLSILLDEGYSLLIDGVNIIENPDALNSDIVVSVEKEVINETTGEVTQEQYTLNDLLFKDVESQYFITESTTSDEGYIVTKRVVADPFPSKEAAQNYIDQKRREGESTAGWNIEPPQIGEFQLEGIYNFEVEFNISPTRTETKTFRSEAKAENYIRNLEKWVNPEDITLTDKSIIFSDDKVTEEEKAQQVGPKPFIQKTADSTVDKPIFADVGSAFITDPDTGRRGKAWSGGEGSAPPDQLSAQMGDAPEARASSTVDKPIFQADYPLGSLGNLVSSKIINSVMRVLRLGKATSIIGLKEFEALSPEEQSAFFEKFADRRAAEFTRKELESLANAEISFGRYIGFKDAHIILVDNRSDNQVQNSLVTAHELGHAFLEESKGLALDNKALRKRLEKAFNKARNKPDAPDTYQRDFGFDEWFSDQLGVWALRLFKESEKGRATKTVPKNVVEKFFKDLVQKLSDMYRAMVPALKKRFRDYDPDFDSFMNEVVARSRGSPDLWTFGKETDEKRLRAVTAQSRGSGGVNTPMFRTESALRKATWQQKALVREMTEASDNKKVQQAAAGFGRSFTAFLNRPNIRAIASIISTEDGVLRRISSVIANMMYAPAQGEGRGASLGFVKAKANAKAFYIAKLSKILGQDAGSWDSEENKAALELAAEGGKDLEHPEANVVSKARDIRKFLEDMYDNYIAKTPGTDIEKRPYYFPVALDIQALANDPALAAKFKNLIMSQDPALDTGTRLTEEAIDNAIDYFIRREQYIQDEASIEIDVTNPLEALEKARQLTSNINPADLAEFSLPPAEALIKYIRHITTRMEFLRATRDPETGADLLQPELAKLPEVDRKMAEAIIKRYMGYRDRDFTSLEKKWLRAGSYAQAFNWVVLLPLITIASITEFGGAVLNYKDFDGVTVGIKQIIHQIQNPDEARELAIDLGLVVPRTLENVIMSDADHEFLDPKVREFSSQFFRVIGLERFTAFTREFAAQMGIQFLRTHAANKTNNPYAARYLRDLGVSAADVTTAWDDKTQTFDFNSEEGQRVRAAIIRFTESSMLRPNTAERPFWANDPRFALVWQLKSFLYSFSKTIGGGMLREMGARLKEQGTSMDKIGGVALTAALAGVAFMPLAMMSLELRELTKAGIASVLPGMEAGSRYFRSDRMDWGPYMVEIFDRAGFNGPMSLVNSMINADKWDKTPLAPALGPTYEIFETALNKGWETFPDRLIPLYATVY